MDDQNFNYVFYQLKNNLSEIESLLENISNSNYDSFLILFSKKIYTLKAITAFYEIKDILEILILIEKINKKIKTLDFFEVWKVLEVYKKLFKKIHENIENNENLNDILKEYNGFFKTPFIYSGERISGICIEPMLESVVYIKKFDIFQVYLFYLEFDEFVNSSDDIKVIRKRWNEFRKVFSNISFENLIELKIRLKKLFAKYNYELSINNINKKIIIMKSTTEKFVEILNIILKIISHKNIIKTVNCKIQKDKRDFIEIIIELNELDDFLKNIFSKLEFSSQEFNNELMGLIDRSFYSGFLPDFIRIKKIIEKSPFSVSFKTDECKIIFYFREDTYVML